jgi:hypothetical protein
MHRFLSLAQALQISASISSYFNCRRAYNQPTYNSSWCSTKVKYFYSEFYFIITNEIKCNESDACSLRGRGGELGN